MNRRRRARSGYAIAVAGVLLVLALASCSASSTPQSLPVGSAESRAPSAASAVAPASASVGTSGDSAEPTMIPTALPTASASIEETPVMGGPGDGGSGSGGPPEPSLGRDEELESRLPQTLNGQPVDIESSLGSDMSPDADPTLQAFLDALGAAQADMSVATGWSADGSWDGQVSALRVRGAQADRILAAFIDAAGASSEAGLTVTNETIGGREVVRIVDRDSPEQGPMYAVAVGDTVYFVQSPTMSIVSEALAAFPS